MNEKKRTTRIQKIEQQIYQIRAMLDGAADCEPYQFVRTHHDISVSIYLCQGMISKMPDGYAKKGAMADLQETVEIRDQQMIRAIGGE
jgi:hypothetical protein